MFRTIRKKKNAISIDTAKALEPPTFRGSRQEKSAVSGLALTQRTGKQDALLSFSHREKPITGIS